VVRFSAPFITRAPANRAHGAARNVEMERKRLQRANSVVLDDLGGAEVRSNASKPNAFSRPIGNAGSGNGWE